MRRSWIVLVAWGSLLIAIALYDLAFGAIGTEIALLGGGGLAIVLIGLLALATERHPAGPVPDGAEPEAIPDLSVATVVFALGMALAIAGFELGPWAMAIGGGTLVIGAGGIVRERLAERR